MTKYPNNQLIVFLVLILSGFGTVIMYSASSTYAMNKYDNYMFFLNQQIKWLIIGLILMFIISNINYYYIKKIAIILLISSWIIMILGYFFKGSNPAARWLILGGRSWLTTSDFARISLIIFTAYFLDKHHSNIKNCKFVLFNYAPFLFITLLLILFQPDTSTTITIGLIILIMLYIASVSWKFIFSILISGIIGIIIKILHTPYVLSRIINWNDGQKIQSLNALGTGGILGSGLGDSIVKNGHLPQAHTDFILPVLGEELGFIGIFILFTLFILLYKIGLSIIKQTTDRFSMFLAIGILSSIIVYFIINSSYVIGFAPTSGLPMPFISYGGSHTIFTLISIGILNNISKSKSFNKNSFSRGFSNA